MCAQILVAQFWNATAVRADTTLPQQPHVLPAAVGKPTASTATPLEWELYCAKTAIPPTISPTMQLEHARFVMLELPTASPASRT